MIERGTGSGSDARCCWCGKGFVRIEGFFWCVSARCRALQAEHAIVADVGGKIRYIHVPLPRQVEFDRCLDRFMLGGGAAGSTKSHQARWGMYRRALAFHDYEGLLLRRTWPELEKHHFRLMEREEKIFREMGLNVKFSITNREMKFHDTGSVIEGGHMENPDDVEKYLSRERDEIVCDEGSTFEPMSLLELSTRARSTKPQILEAGFRGLFRVYTNPGGPASSMLRDFFIDHEPNWDDFPPELKDDYDPSEWVYIPGNLDDNPYLPESYRRDLAVLAPWRYQQLRYNDWDIVAGLFFTEFAASVHVRDLGDPGDNCEWFRSLDWGYIQPGWVGWWACLPDETYYIRHEHKYSHTPIPRLCEDIVEKTADWGVRYLRYTAADPALWGPDVTKTDLEGEDMNETFAKNGVPLIKSRNDRVNGWQRVRELLRDRGSDAGPSLIIHPDCRYLIRTLAAAVSAKNNPEDIDTHIDDHPLDGVRYGAMSRPSPTRLKVTRSTKTFKAKQEQAKKFNRSLRRR